MPDTKQYNVGAVERALKLLEALGERPRSGVTALAQRLDMTKATVFRLLSTLEHNGFVVREPDQPVYSLGYRMAVLGERAGAQDALLAAARPVMERLRDATSENVNLIVREGARSLVLSTLSGRHAIRIFALAGRHGPLHAGGGSLMLLAWAPESVREALLSGPLERFTDQTETDPEALRARLAQVRSQGYHIAVNDLDEGAFSVAAPIRGSRGTVDAAISIAGAVQRFDAEKRRTYLDLVLASAAEISQKLGLGMPPS